MKVLRTRGFVNEHGRLTVIDVPATLGKSDAESEGEMVPPWAQPHFSFAFSGQPPLEAYADVIRYEAVMNGSLIPVEAPEDEDKRVAPGGSPS